jgi:glycerol-3-phosphate dehydrogenase
MQKTAEHSQWRLIFFVFFVTFVCCVLSHRRVQRDSLRVFASSRLRFFDSPVGACSVTASEATYNLIVSRLRGIEGQRFDVIVVGGGIIGCGIARDAALRGLHVALVEQRDFGSGTTANSTRIVHGGLRYLEMLDFRLVRMDLRERETLLRIAPHLVAPLEFAIPFLSRAPLSRIKIRAGLALYDTLSYDKSLPSHRMLNAAGARALDRALDRDDVRGAATYFDARVDLPERLALENALDAERHGASILNYCEATSTLMDDRGAAGIRVHDAIDGQEGDIRGRIVVNATGPWLEHGIRKTKGVHIVCPPVTDRALVIFSAVDRRLMFAIPRGGQTWIGTTDTDYEGDPAAARATRADVEYLLASVRHLFPQLGIDDVLYTTAGVRALVMHGGSASSVSRMHKVVEDTPGRGVVSVLGGKITGYRAIAEDVTDVVCRRLGRAAVCTTARTPLPVPPQHRDLAAHAAYAVEHEHSVHLSDFMRRRTTLGASADQGWSRSADVAAAMAARLGWTPEHTSTEIDDYRRNIESTRAFR